MNVLRHKGCQNVPTKRCLAWYGASVHWQQFCCQQKYIGPHKIWCSRARRRTRAKYTIQMNEYQCELLPYLVEYTASVLQVHHVSGSTVSTNKHTRMCVRIVFALPDSRVVTVDWLRDVFVFTCCCRHGAC